MYSFRISFWTVPESLREVRALLLRHREIQRQQNGRGGVDGHGSGHPLERNAREKGFHVLQRINRHADAAHLTARQGMIGIETDLGGQIEGHGQPCLALGEQVTETRVRLLGRSEAGVLAHCPQAAPVAGGMDAACEGILARETQVQLRVPSGQVFGPEGFLQF